MFSTFVIFPENAAQYWGFSSGNSFCCEGLNGIYIIINHYVTECCVRNRGSINMIMKMINTNSVDINYLKQMDLILFDIV